MRLRRRFARSDSLASNGIRTYFGCFASHRFRCVALCPGRPDRKRQKQSETKEHWTKVEERYLTRAFKEAREAADCYNGWKEEEMPGFHEVRALSLHLYKKAGKDGQKIAEHSSKEMTKNYQKEHAEAIWSGVIPEFDISEITG
jgi:hypothetical protein